jgi:hypothetical protein
VKRRAHSGRAPLCKKPQIELKPRTDSSPAPIFYCPSPK